MIEGHLNPHQVDVIIAKRRGIIRGIVQNQRLPTALRALLGGEAQADQIHAFPVDKVDTMLIIVPKKDHPKPQQTSRDHAKHWPGFDPGKSRPWEYVSCQGSVVKYSVLSQL